MYERVGFTFPSCVKRHLQASLILLCLLMEKNAFYLRAKHESANWGHYFYVSNWRRGRHFTWSSEPRDGLAVCRVKAVFSFLSYFKTKEYWSGRGNRTRDHPRPPAVQSSALPTELRILGLSVNGQ